MAGLTSARRRALQLTAIAVALALGPWIVPASADPNNNNSAKLRSAVTLQGVRAHQAAFQAIADSNGGNRFAGLSGHDDSATYVADKLTAAGYNVSFHEFVYNAFFEVTPGEMDQVSPTPTTYVNGNDFDVMTYSGSGDVTAPLQAPSGSAQGCVPGDFGGFTAGDIALVIRGGCTFRVKTNNATAAGASAILVYNSMPGLLNGTLSEAGGLSAIPALGIPQALGQSLLAQMGESPVTMHVFTDTDARPLTTRNVLAETPGGNADNTVMVGAHLDSVDAGPGINDNGSGSAAILEVALQMAKVKPQNKVRFAWWSAEESGLVGSTRYVQSRTPEELEDIALYLNFDMIGSPNFVRFVYDGDNSTGLGAVGPAGSDVIERYFVGYFESQGLASAPTPFNGRSDYGPFINVGIPAGGLFTGAEGIKTPEQAALFGGTAGTAYDPCYHAACDNYSNNSDTALDQMSDAVAHVVISLAQNTEAVNGIKGKGNFKGGPGGGSNGGGSGGGSGHDEEVDS